MVAPLWGRLSICSQLEIGHPSVARALLFSPPRLCPPHAQYFTQRGFLETSAVLFPQTAPNDGAHAVGEALFRYEAFYKLTNLRFAAAVDARTDTHQETAMGRPWWDRARRRPASPCGACTPRTRVDSLTVEAGKQLIRWGKTDVLTPTDRFAPRDFLNVVDSDFLAITAARVTYGTQSNTMDAGTQPAPHAQPRSAAQSALGGTAAGIPSTN